MTIAELQNLPIGTRVEIDADRGKFINPTFSYGTIADSPAGPDLLGAPYIRWDDGCRTWPLGTFTESMSATLTLI